MKHSVKFVSIKIVALSLGMLIVYLNVYTVLAQRTISWSPQLPIPDYGIDSRPPFLIADQNRTVHAFYDRSIGDADKAIFYRQWSVSSDWTSAVDILLPNPTINTPLQGVFMDKLGMFHLIFYQGSIDRGDILYTRAWAGEASRSRAWSKPFEIGLDANPLLYARLVGDGQERLFLVYSGVGDGIGLYEVHSLDRGDTWSSPQEIVDIARQGRFPYSIRPFLDSRGQLHVVWSVMNEEGIGEEVYYASLNTGTFEWGAPFRLAFRSDEEYSANWPAIIEHEGELFVIYQDSRPATLWMRRSKNYGLTWSDPIRPFDHVGESENVELLTDSTGSMHMVHGNRVGEPIVGGMWHSIWQGGFWSEFEPVVVALEGSRVFFQGQPISFAPSGPRAVISQGNVLLITWWTDTSGGPRNGAWYSYALLDAPEQPVNPLPTPPVTPSPTAEPVSTVSASTDSPPGTPVSLEPTRQISFDSAPPANLRNPAEYILIGILPVIVLLISVVVIRSFTYRGH